MRRNEHYRSPNHTLSFGLLSSALENFSSAFLKYFFASSDSVRSKWWPGDSEWSHHIYFDSDSSSTLFLVDKSLCVVNDVDMLYTLANSLETLPSKVQKRPAVDTALITAFSSTIDTSHSKRPPHHRVTPSARRCRTSARKQTAASFNV